MSASWSIRGCDVISRPSCHIASIPRDAMRSLLWNVLFHPPGSRDSALTPPLPAPETAIFRDLRPSPNHLFSDRDKGGNCIIEMCKDTLTKRRVAFSRLGETSVVLCWNLTKVTKGQIWLLFIPFHFIIVPTENYYQRLPNALRVSMVNAYYILIEEIIICMEFLRPSETDKTGGIHIMGVAQCKRALSVARIVF